MAAKKGSKKGSKTTRRRATASKKWSTGAMVGAGAAVLGALFVGYQFTQDADKRIWATKSAGLDGVGEAGEYSDVESQHGEGVARNKAQAARQDARAARAAARTQRARQRQAHAAAERAGQEATALEQRADTSERAAAHAETLASYGGGAGRSYEDIYA